MTQPILPLYIAELQGSMDKIVLISGIVFSIVGISGVIASPPWGILGQSWEFRPVLYLSLLLSGIFGIIQAIPQDLGWFTGLRFLVVWLLPHLSRYKCGSHSKHNPSDRGKVFGYSYAAQQFGSVIGPIIGGCLATLAGNQITLAISGALLLPLAVMLYFCRPKNVQATGTPMDHK